MSLAEAAKATRSHRVTWTRTPTGERWIVCPPGSDAIAFSSKDEAEARAACDHLNLAAALIASKCDDGIWMESAAIDAGAKLHLDPVTCLEIWDAMLDAMPALIRATWNASARMESKA